MHRDTKRLRGIAYIKYLLPEDAVAAYRALDMNAFQGRLMHVLPAKKKPGEDKPEALEAERHDGEVCGINLFSYFCSLIGTCFVGFSLRVLHQP